MAIQKSGRDLWAQALSNANNGTAGEVKEFKGAGSIEIVAEGGPGWTVNAYAGQDVVIEKVVGTILSNTNEKLVIARWETPGNRGGEPATAPVGKPKFVIEGGICPAQWMALSPSETAPTVGGASTSLTEEITNGKTGAEAGGLNRKVSTWGHTPGTTTFTLTATYTVNTFDELPGGKQKVAKIGILNASKEGKLLFETLLSATAELKAVGDSIAVTDTVSGT